MFKKYISAILPLSLVLVVWSCGDDSPTGPDLSEAPDAPTLENVEMDFSVFEHADNFSSFQMKDHEDFHKTLQSIQEDSEFTPYEQAAMFASMAQLWFHSMGQLPNAWFQEHQWGEPEVDGDTWIWEWSFSAEGESLTMTVTAETVGDERHWELRYTTEGSENDLDNALLIASQVRLDGSGGSWQLYDFFEDEPVFVVDYELDGELTTMVEMQYDEEEDGHFLYERDGDFSTLQLWDVINSASTTIQWNNDIGTGSIQSAGYRDGEEVCWNEQFEETAC